MIVEFTNSKKKVYKMEFEGFDDFIKYYFKTSHDTKIHNIIKGKEILNGERLFKLWMNQKFQ